MIVLNGPADFGLPERSVAYRDIPPRAETHLAADDAEVRGAMIILLHPDYPNEGTGGCTDRRQVTLIHSCRQSRVKP